jgi:hypothetical protein
MLVESFVPSLKMSHPLVLSNDTNTGYDVYISSIETLQNKHYSYLWSKFLIDLL